MTGAGCGRLRLARLLFIAALAVIALSSGCSGARFDGTTYRGDGFTFRVAAPPPTWKRIDVSHAALAFRDETRDATIAVNGRCGVDGEDVPLASLTQHLFLQFTDREILEQKVTPIDSRDAMNTILLAKLDGVPKKFDVWVLKKDGCVYDFYYIAAPQRFAEGVAEFDRFVQSFATVSDHVD